MNKPKNALQRMPKGKAEKAKPPMKPMMGKLPRKNVKGPRI